MGHLIFQCLPTRETVLSCGKARGRLRKLLIFLCAAVLAVPSLPLRAECLSNGVTCWRRSGAATSERDSNETHRYVLTICMCLSSERDIIVALMDVREGTRNFSLCLRRQSACRHWALCNFYFLQPRVIACLSACIFFFFFTRLSRACLDTLSIAEWLCLFFKCTKRKLSFVCLICLYAGVVSYNILAPHYYNCCHYSISFHLTHIQWLYPFMAPCHATISVAAGCSQGSSRPISIR